MKKLNRYLRPHCLLGFRFLFPISQAHQRLHRQVIISAFPARPRWQWFLLLVLLLIYWFGFEGWRRLYSVFRKIRTIGKNRFNKSHAEIINDLLILTFYFGASPSSYLLFYLHRYPRTEWLDWHSVLSCPPLCLSQKLLGNKEQCASLLRAAGNPTIETLAILRQGERLNPEQLFNGRSLFIKPIDSNGMRGCLALYYDAQRSEYTLKGRSLCREWIKITKKNEIIDFILQMLRSHNLMVQPLLVNDQAISTLCHATDLVTIRIISGIYRTQVTVVYAILEIPVDKFDDYWLVNIDCGSGLLTGTGIIDETAETEPGYEGDDCAEYARFVNQVKGNQIPYWTAITDSVAKAHSLFDDVVTIGWDLAITPSGPVIIEGNTNWWVVPLQCVSSVPILQSPLREIYLQ